MRTKSKVTKKLFWNKYPYKVVITNNLLRLDIFRDFPHTYDYNESYKEKFYKNCEEDFSKNMNTLSVPMFYRSSYMQGTGNIMFSRNEYDCIKFLDKYLKDNQLRTRKEWASLSLFFETQHEMYKLVNNIPKSTIKEIHSVDKKVAEFLSRNQNCELTDNSNIYNFKVIITSKIPPTFLNWYETHNKKIKLSRYTLNEIKNNRPTTSVQLLVKDENALKMTLFTLHLMSVNTPKTYRLVKIKDIMEETYDKEKFM